MTIDEAIELNEAMRKDLLVKGLPSLASTMQLGIEALKRYKEACANPGSINLALLPGETEDKGVT